MTDTIALTGVVATVPRHITTSEGLDITSFRLASSQRRYDRQQNTWIETGTNWYTITAFRQLASNLATSISKGDRVLATGRLRIREWEKAEKNGMTVEIEAESVGHDLAWGSAHYSRTQPEARTGAASHPLGQGELEPGAPGGGSLGFAGQREDGRADEGGVEHHSARLDADGFFPASDADSELLSQ